MTADRSATDEAAQPVLVVEHLARRRAFSTAGYEPAMPIWQKLRRPGRYGELPTFDDGGGGGDVDDGGMDDAGMDDDVDALEIDMISDDDPEAVTRSWAVDDVTFSVLPGEGLAIVGNSGSGAAVLFRVLDRMLLPDRGRAIIAGRASRSVAYNMAIAPRYTTLAKQAAAMAMAASVPRRERRAWMEDLLAVAFGGDGARKTSDPRQSVRRLATAAATDSTADLLLIDDITILGDTPYRDMCIERARAAMSAGAGAIVVGQKPVPMLELCSRAILFEDGRIVDEGEPSRLIDLARGNAGLGSVGRRAQGLKVPGFDACAAILAASVASSASGIATIKIELETASTDVWVEPRIVLSGDESGPVFVLNRTPLPCPVPSRYLITAEASLPDDLPPLAVDFYAQIRLGDSTSEIGRERIGMTNAQPAQSTIEGADDGGGDGGVTELHAEWKFDAVGEAE